MTEVKLYSGGDVAIKAGVHIGSLQWAMKRGELVSTSGFRLHGMPLYTNADIARFIRRLKSRRHHKRK